MSYRLQVLIPESLAARLQKAADRSRLSRSAWVRRVIERALEEERAVRDPLTSLSGLNAPTGDIDQMLTEIEAGRG
ncbi:MAG: CopG family transcriptional regulator [Gemmatimonadota bacterium]